MNIAREARLMLRTHRYGTLCTISKRFDGYPFGSITPYLAEHDGSILVFISTLAEHTKNIQHDPRISLITYDQSDPHIQSQGRVTVVGNAQLEPDREYAGLRYLRYFPESQTYFEMHDFSFYRIRPVAIRYIGGFGKIHWVNLDEYATPQLAQFAKQEESLLAEINVKQQSILCKLLQQRHGIDTANVQAIGIDCDGLDVRCNERLWRLDFPEAVSSPSLEALASLKKAAKVNSRP